MDHKYVSNHNAFQSTGVLRLRHGVSVAIADPGLKQQVEAAIQAEGKGFVAVAGFGVETDFQVAVVEASRRREFQIQDPDGHPVPHLRRPIDVAENGAVSRLVGRLVHLARYRAVQAIEAPGLDAHSRLEVSLLGGSPSSFAEAPIFAAGDHILLRVRNAQPPTPADSDDSQNKLNITILVLQSDWEISQIHPAQMDAVETLRPEQEITLRFQALLPEHVAETLDLIKVFGTRGRTSFWCLELPVLDQPARLSGRREPNGDPLEAALAAITADEALLDNVLLPQDVDWTAAQVELWVKKPPEPRSEMERRLRPGGDSGKGFLGCFESLEDVLARDDETLAALGLSHEKLATALETVVSAARDQASNLLSTAGKWDEYHNRSAWGPDLYSPETLPRFSLNNLPDMDKGYQVDDLQVFLTQYRGFQECPWGCPAVPEWSSFDFLILDRTTGEFFTGPGLCVHLIREHHFFEGLGTPFRVDPVKAARVLGLTPLHQHSKTEHLQQGAP